ncbi:hypothetical protein BDD12DRAFT_808006 [Trichophaea hybrida]|nr:hypothetical protein BDD12DRAFT_808006 [Trichophaea hybrida]
MPTSSTPTPTPQNPVISLSVLTKSASCDELATGLKPSSWRRVYLDALDIHLLPDGTTTTSTASTSIATVIHAFPTPDLQAVAALFLRSLHDPDAFSYEDYQAGKRSPSTTAPLISRLGYKLMDLQYTYYAGYAAKILRLLASTVRVGKPIYYLYVTNQLECQSTHDPDSALRLSFRGASTTIYPRCLLQFEQAAPLIAVVEVKRGDDRYHDLSAAACAYLLAVAQCYFYALPTATVASPVVLIEHTQLRQEHDPDMQAYLQICEHQPRFVSYVLYRAEIPRVYIDEPGCMRISVTVSRRYSTEVEEDRVALGSSLVDAVLRTVAKAENDAAVLGKPPIQTEPEPFRRKKAMKRTADGRERNLAGEASNRKRKKREDKVESQI